MPSIGLDLCRACRCSKSWWFLAGSIGRGPKPVSHPDSRISETLSQRTALFVTPHQSVHRAVASNAGRCTLLQLSLTALPQPCRWPHEHSSSLHYHLGVDCTGSAVLSASSAWSFHLSSPCSTHLFSSCRIGKSGFVFFTFQLERCVHLTTNSWRSSQWTLWHYLAPSEDQSSIDSVKFNILIPMLCTVLLNIWGSTCPWHGSRKHSFDANILIFIMTDSK